MAREVTAIHVYFNKFIWETSCEIIQFISLFMKLINITEVELLCQRTFQIVSNTKLLLYGKDL